MGFKSTIQGLVQSAFVTIGDIAEPIIYTSITDGNYDTYSGQIVNVETSYNINVIVKYPMLQGDKVGGNETEIGFTGDISILFAAKDLAVTPSTQDTITRNNEIYSINSIASDAVTATYTLNLVRLG